MKKKYNYEIIRSWTIRNKDTKKLFTVCSKISSSRGNTWYITEDGKKIIEKDLDYIIDNFEVPENFDYKKIVEVLVSQLVNDEDIYSDLNNILNAFARRLHPGGYYHEGDLVYFIRPDFFIENTKDICYAWEYYCGANNPWLIKEIRPDSGDMCKSYIVLCRYSDSDKNNSQTINIPIHSNKIYRSDAYSLIRKYGTLY